jgi:hypothetical protein
MNGTPHGFFFDTKNFSQHARATDSYPQAADDRQRHSNDAADAANILEKGTGANDEVIRPPMHIYHLTHADAQAIVAYLRSLPTGHD